MNDFEDKIAIVTGAGRGIGLATAEILAAGGAHVLIADIDATEADAAADAIGGESWVGDLTDPRSPAEMVAAATDRWGRLDIVVNNAGYTLDGAGHKMSDGDFQAMLDIHTVVPFRVLRAAAPYLREPAKKERATGQEVFRKVVNVASVSAYGNAGQANYATAKAGVIGLTKSFAKEWGAFKIGVNAVAFGLIDTRLTAPKDDTTVIDVRGREVQVGIPEQMRTALDAQIPMGRAGSAREAAGAIAFLCSPWSNYVTGQVINVAGGLSVGMSS